MRPYTGQITGRLPGTKGYKGLRIINKFPPNISDINAVVSLTGNEIFAWGDIIYNPSGAKLTRELLAHERTHSKQQGKDIEGWWKRYLTDTKFRFRQELEAHHVEYAVYNSIEPNRNRRRIFLKHLAKRLSSSMYGSLITFNNAKNLLKAGPKGV